MRFRVDSLLSFSDIQNFKMLDCDRKVKIIQNEYISVLYIITCVCNSYIMAESGISAISHWGGCHSVISADIATHFCHDITIMKFAVTSQ